MKKKKMPFWLKLVIIGLVLFVFTGLMSFFKEEDSRGFSKAGRASILALDLKGPLIDKHKFLKDLRDLSQNPAVRGILIRLDSPGGSVALSQEIYYEFKRIKEVLKKPVVISVGSMMASGALYSAMGASSILVQAGTLVGSIGVIFPMVNMERLYDWAKVEPYSIKTGEFKDAGAPFRQMTSRERVLFQDLVNELLEQFKSAILESRKMRPEDLDLYTDARVFTGDTAVSAGFADSIGTYSDAIELVGELAGLGKKPKLFSPKPSYFDFFSARWGGDSAKGFLPSVLKDKGQLLSLLGIHIGARPLYIFPPAIGL